MVSCREFLIDGPPLKRGELETPMQFSTMFGSMQGRDIGQTGRVLDNWCGSDVKDIMEDVKTKVQRTTTSESKSGVVFWTSSLIHSFSAVKFVIRVFLGDSCHVPYQFGWMMSFFSGVIVMLFTFSLRFGLAHVSLRHNFLSSSLLYQQRLV